MVVTVWPTSAHREPIDASELMFRSVVLGTPVAVGQTICQDTTDGRWILIDVPIDDADALMALTALDAGSAEMTIKAG